jgi:hypothetical protein
MFPIKIISIQSAGGACPYQIEATTDNGQFFYLRYRGGRLRAGVALTESSFNYNNAGYNIIDKVIGEPLDGYPAHETISRELQGLVEFPEGFKHIF